MTDSWTRRDYGAAIAGFTISGLILGGDAAKDNIEAGKKARQLQPKFEQVRQDVQALEYDDLLTRDRDIRFNVEGGAGDFHIKMSVDTLSEFAEYETLEELLEEESYLRDGGAQMFESLFRNVDDPQRPQRQSAIKEYTLVFEPQVNEPFVYHIDRKEIQDLMYGKDDLDLQGVYISTLDEDHVGTDRTPNRPY